MIEDSRVLAAVNLVQVISLSFFVIGLVGLKRLYFKLDRLVVRFGLSYFH